MTVLFPVAVWAQEAETTDEEVVTLSAFEVSGESVVGYATTSSLSASRIAVPITDIAGSVITINERLIDDTLAVGIGDTFNLVSGITTSENSELQETKAFSIRGYKSSSAQRDGIPDLGFSNNGGFDYSMLERIEIVKGPAGVQYGQHNSGGVVNFISKRPLPENRTKLSAIYGSYNSWRLSADVSNMSKTDQGSLGIRVAATILNTDGIIGLASEVNKPASYFINPSVSYEFNNGLKVWGWARIVDDQSSRLATNAFIFGTPDGRGKANTDFAGTSSINVWSGQFVESKVYETGLSKSFDIGEVKADVRLLARFGDLEQGGDRTRANDNVVIIDNDGNQIPDGSPSVGRGPTMSAAIENDTARFGRQGLRYTKTIVPQTQDETIYAVDLNLDFKIGPARNKLLLYTQWRSRDANTGALDQRLNNSGTLPADIRKIFGFETGVFIDPARIVNTDNFDRALFETNGNFDGQPDNAFLEGLKGGAKRTSDDCLAIMKVYECHQGIVEIWPNPYNGDVDLRPIIDQYANQRIDRGSQQQTRSLWNFAAIERLFLFDDRLILSGGIRFDRDDATTETVINNAPQGPKSTSDESTTYNYGAVGKLYKGEHGEGTIFYNYAETFVPVFKLDARLATFGNRFPNREVATNEFGVKVNVWGSRLVGTFSYFDTVESNILVGFRDEDGSVTGVDDTSYQAPAGEQTTTGFEMDLAMNPMPGLYAIVSYGSMESFIADGAPNWQTPDSTFSWLINYTFQGGPLKNFSITPSYIYWGDSRLNRASNFQLPPGDRYDLVLGYKWGRMNIRFRIENLENDIDSQPSTWWTGAGATKQTNYRFGVDYTF